MKNAHSAIARAIAFLLSFSLLFSGCSPSTTEKSNLIITNHSPEPLMSIGYETPSGSGGVENADNSPLLPGQEVAFSIENGTFRLSLTDITGREAVSQSFFADPDDARNQPLHITIEKDPSGSYVFHIT